MIVFADPATPQASAPITINVVLIDAKGDPVQGKKVTATFATELFCASFTITEGGAATAVPFTAD